MKRMKKFLAVLLAAVMVMAMGSVSVFADGTVTLTVTGSTGGTVTAAGSTSGAITSGSTSVTTGETVTLTVTPESGYVLSALTVTDGESNSVSVTGSGSTYTFTMPSTAVTVSATFVSGSYSIIITNEDATNGETYKAYKVFDLTYDANTGAYSYTIKKDSTFWSAILALSNLVTNDNTIAHTDPSTAYFTLKQSASDDDVYVVTVLSTATEDGSLTSAVVEALANVTLPQTADETGTLSDGTATITLTDAGYYFVTTTTGSAVILNSTAPTVLLADKNTAPSVDKIVSDTENGTYGSLNSAAIGDTVYYKAVISNINDASNIVFHDTMSEGLTFNSSSVVVKLNDSSVLTSGSSNDYEVTSPGTEGTDPCTFEIDFSDYLSNNASSLMDSSTLVIYYTATVNSNATLGSTANTNDAQVSYGNSSKSTKSTTYTYVYDLYIYKYTGTLNNGETALSGAKFQLTNASGDVAYFTYTAASNTYELVGWTNDVSSLSTSYTAVITSDATNMIYIKGLDAGVTYTLTETEAPSGYNLLTSAITLYINGNAGSITSITDSNGGKSITSTVSGHANTIPVQNNTGSTIPVTGGMGTTILYIIGAILVIGAAVILVTRRRMANK